MNASHAHNFNASVGNLRISTHVICILFAKSTKRLPSMKKKIVENSIFQNIANCIIISFSKLQDTRSTSYSTLCILIKFCFTVELKKISFVYKSANKNMCFYLKYPVFFTE